MISFYDQGRMGYGGDVGVPRDGALAEWMIGNYPFGGGEGVDEGGEFAIQLIEFKHTGGWRPDPRGVRLRAYTDGLGSLRQFLETRAFDAIHAFGDTVTAEHVTGALIGAGIPDRSRVPL